MRPNVIWLCMAVKQYVSFPFPTPYLLKLLMDLNVLTLVFAAVFEYMTRRGPACTAVTG